jgi:predicted dehydrogenase
MSPTVRPAGRKLRLGMVGGGEGAFIGAVHRRAAALDGQFELVAGALSSTPERSRASGAALGLELGRSYDSWEAMLSGEQGRADPIDAVSIVTPNHLHFPVARAFVDAGFNVVCDKPLVHTTEQAEELLALARERGVVFAVTYNYSGYPMVRQARAMVRSGALGTLRKVTVEYHQGWLAEDERGKQADWRTDPARSGLGGALGDIGSHAEHLLRYVSGLEIQALSAELSTFVPGRRLDDDAVVLLRLSGGAKGLIQCSQIEIGRENDLRLGVFGTQGSLSWRQETPNELIYDRLGQPRQLLTRGNAYLSAEATAATRLPPGHPEAFLEAFANIYLGAAAHIRARLCGEAHLPDYPGLDDGLRGVRFIEQVVQNSRSSQRWTELELPPA